MGARIKKLKKIRIHREGTNELTLSMLALLAIGSALWFFIDSPIPFWLFIVVFGMAWIMALNFYRCPIRYFNGDTEKLVVAPADGKIVVVEEAEENEYFHDKRLMISIFMRQAQMNPDSRKQNIRRSGFTDKVRSSRLEALRHAGLVFLIRKEYNWQII